MDLKAEELRMRTAGLPGGVSPRCPSQRTSFHDAPKAAFTLFPNIFTSESDDDDDGSSKMHVSAAFSMVNHNQFS